MSESINQSKHIYTAPYVTNKSFSFIWKTVKLHQFTNKSALSKFTLLQKVTGTFVPENFHSREWKFHRWKFRSLELSSPGTKVPNIKISMELSFPNIDY